MSSSPNQKRDANNFIESMSYSSMTAPWLLCLLLIWLKIIVAQAGLFLLLSAILRNTLQGTQLLALIGFLASAVFAGLAVDAEFRRQSAANFILTWHTFFTGSVIWLIPAAIALPFVFIIVGILLVWIPQGNATAGFALIIAATGTTFSNAFSWFFSCLLIKQALNDGDRRVNLDGTYAAFSMADLRLKVQHYAPPLNSAMLGIIAIGSLFLAFTINLSKNADVGLLYLIASSLLIPFFALISVAALAIRRYQTLIQIRRYNGTSQTDRSNAIDESRHTLPWLTQFVVTIFVLTLLAASLPLRSIVNLSDFFSINSGETRPKPDPTQILPSTGSMKPSSLPATFEILAWILFVAVVVLFSWIVWRWMRKHNIPARLKAKIMSMLAKLLLLLRRLLRHKEPVSDELKANQNKDKKEHLFDIFEHPEVLDAFSPSETIIATYHLLLEYSLIRGWIKRKNRPPFEILQKLLQISNLGISDLTLLTWSYARAAYSPTPANAADVDSVRKAWHRLKPNLMPAKSGTDSQSDSVNLTD